MSTDIDDKVLSTVQLIERPQRRVPDWVLATLTPCALLILWEIGVALKVIDGRFFPPPSLIVRTGVDLVLSGRLAVDTVQTLIRLSVGFVIGAVFGVAIGLILGGVRTARVMFEPILSGLYVIPKIAILPLIMIVFGIGEQSKFAIVALATFFVVCINTMAGVRAVEPILIEAGRSFGARGFNMFLHILLPGALPYIFNGLRLGCGTGLLVVVAAEFVAADSGVGYMIWNSWTMLITEKMYVGFVVISLVGVSSAALIERCRRMVMPWEAGRSDRNRPNTPPTQAEA